MTIPDTLVERLRATEGTRPDSIGICTMWHRNPDGPEAADRIAELEDDLRIWKSEAANRSQGMIDLNLDRAAMGVENQKLREQLTEAHAHAVQLAEALERWADWHRKATADDDCQWLNDQGWPVSETYARESRTALANFNAWRVG